MAPEKKKKKQRQKKKKTPVESKQSAADRATFPGPSPPGGLPVMMQPFEAKSGGADLIACAMHVLNSDYLLVVAKGTTEKRHAVKFISLVMATHDDVDVICTSPVKQAKDGNMNMTVVVPFRWDMTTLDMPPRSFFVQLLDEKKQQVPMGQCYTTEGDGDKIEYHGAHPRGLVVELLFHPPTPYRGMFEAASKFKFH
jgi:hypothetical protein